MNNYNVKYYYAKKDGGSKTTSSFAVKADSDIVALDLEKQQAQGKHPNHQVVILEIKKK